MHIWLALALFLISHPASAEPQNAVSTDPVSTRELVNFCSWGTNWGEGFCHGYLTRMIESYECYVADPAHPYALGYIELNSLFRDYATKNPEKMDRPAAETLSTVLAEIWPCP